MYGFCFVCVSQFSKKTVIDSYTSFINNWKQAKEAIKSTCNSKPAFAKYLEVNPAEMICDRCAANFTTRYENDFCLLSYFSLRLENTKGN